MHRPSIISHAGSDSADRLLEGFKIDDATREGAVATEISRHFLSNLSATRGILETYMRWSVRSWPFRFLTVLFENLLIWKKPEVNILSAIVFSVSCIYPVIAISFLPSIFLSLLWYMRLLRRTGVLHSTQKTVPWKTNRATLSTIAEL